ncbi:LD-carboxypeptidase [Sphingomicrobium lutaoense]|uniref:Muramoyltetrapeptide carboxypeptidase n=1 Tax=Sphingomicrobium lutaoense TaxID=515949 RepID=A0A839Z270_9SPHN|nr:LD-carboxypeptidase [Sphingomicrobium lutaoense]MBB3764137.1 muramoyltetrapeptide carboxypeptidase [Sphingomicrobium lutaoense]
MKIAVVAPSCPIDPTAADKARERAAAMGAELFVHDQCFASDGHFAGPDEQRLAALRDVMADETIHAVWMARGGYGSNRIAERAVEDLPSAARQKLYMGYSDAGFLLAALCKSGCQAVHGPMVQDGVRDDGEAALERALAWMVRRHPAALEPGLREGKPAMAFNLTVLSHLLGTALEPDFTGVDLMVEEVAEHDYRIDRAMFHVTGQASVRKVARLRRGRMSDIPENDRPFGSEPAAIFSDWCRRSGIVDGGSAEIGHDADNRVVPFPL